MLLSDNEGDLEAGLDYFLARYFSGAQGRYTSPDWSETPHPVPYADLTEPQTLNLYTYGRNNPLRWTDPTAIAPLTARSTGFCGASRTRWASPKRRRRQSEQEKSTRRPWRSLKKLSGKQMCAEKHSFSTVRSR
jgi:RHS repeat-associated protein